MASFRKFGYVWEFRVRYKDPYTQKYKEKSKRGFKTKKEAQIAAAEEEKKLLNGLEVEITPTSLKYYLRDWLKLFKQDNVRKNTYILHDRNIEKHLIPYFKNINLKELKPMMYQKFINSLTDQGYSKQTVQIIHGTMNNAMKKAVSLKKIENNPCEEVIISNKNNKEREGLKYMRSEDISLFLKTSYQYNYIYYIFFKMLLNTGMRKGEAAALQWKDINLKEQTITISKTLDFTAKTKEEVFGDTKTFTSKRTIMIPKKLADELLAHKKWQNTNKLVLQEAYEYELDLVFSRMDGKFLPKSTLFNAFSRILKKANLPKLEIHSLRHTHAVLLLESGASMKYIQDRLGHKSIEITSNVYSHISDKINKDSISEFEAYMNNVLG
ncbi:tyrosine-type recombinase/integrase [Bacillus sp. 166amftsu]|uniref:tyrosine-type recombinase/integrase n=1 Tax=Bacillus sp. 166amftsu TaxID=1761753 RepID=UPI00089C67D4|nr:tyrosine-type recombinase/integrase [Bacillus sp. 166amftsu]SDY38061.1 Site-specific recombinase XerD [Bacillus sp. 166amftsu]